MQPSRYPIGPFHGTAIGGGGKVVGCNKVTSTILFCEHYTALQMQCHISALYHFATLLRTNAMLQNHNTATRHSIFQHRTALHHIAILQYRTAKYYIAMPHSTTPHYNTALHRTTLQHRTAPHHIALRYRTANHHIIIPHLPARGFPGTCSP